MEIHIGELIKKRLEEVGMKKSEFGRRINRTSQNVYDIFERKSLDTGLLHQISLILDRNFFEILSIRYAQEVTSNLIVEDEKGEYLSTSELISKLNTNTRELKHCNEIKKQLEKEVSYLNEINELLKKKKGK